MTQAGRDNDALTGLRTAVGAAYGYWVWVACVVVIGVALRWPSVDGAMLADDWDHYAMFAGVYPVRRSPLDVFDFVSGSASERAALLEAGRLPWWSDPRLQLSVLRPLSSALSYFDFSVLGMARSPRAAHLHTLAWWVLLVCGVAALLRRLLAPGVAMLALALYAVDDAHTLPVSWIANRSEIVSIGFAVWGLYAHVRAREQGSRRLRIASWLLVSLALLAGEHAFAPLAYFVAVELCDVAAPWATRVRRALPFVALAGAYMIARGVLGYGVKGTSFYVDPIADPLRYLAACASRLPLLVGDLVTGYAAEWHRWPPPWRPQWLAWHVLPASWLSVEALLHWQRWSGVASVLLVIVACLYLRRTKQQQQLRWLLVGATLSLIPVCGTVANSRLTISAAIGFNAALAYALFALSARFRSAPRAQALARATALAVVAVLVLGAHVAYAAVRTYGETVYYAMRARDEVAWAVHADLGMNDARGKHVIVIAAPDWLAQFGLPYAWTLSGRPLPASTELLSADAEAPHTFTRVSPNVLDLQLPNSPNLGFRASVYRREDAGFAVGDVLRADRFTVQTLAAHGGEPTRLRFTFPADLDAGAYIFLYPRFDGLKSVHMPALGETLQLPPPAWPAFVP